MFKKLNTNETIDTMVDVLKKDGIFIVENFLDNNETEDLNITMKKLCLESGGHYEFGRNYRGGNLKSYRDTNPNLFKSFDHKWMRELSEKYIGKSNYGDNVYSTYDFISSKELGRNGWLHFDRHHCLKFFIYLTDTTKESGAFTCAKGSRKIGEELRKDAWKNKNYNDVPNRIELDYSDLLIEFPGVPVEAPKGTLIVFDTDTFHKGGEVNEGKERLVVRLHNYFK